MRLRTIRRIVRGRNTKEGRIFDYTIQILIIISLVSFSIETLPGLSPQAQTLLQLIEIVTTILFTVEYLLRLTVAKRKFKFIFSFFGIIDLVAFLPFYFSWGVDMRFIRAFRLLRLFRILKLVRYSKALRRFNQALMIAKEELVLYLSMTMLLLYLSAVGIYYFEHEAQPEIFSSVFHSLWWSVATLTTVGYGDIYPITTGGRLFTFFVLLLGLGVVSVPAGLISSALSKAKAINEEKDCR